MGIRAIEYRPWKGDRTDPNQRWLVIAKQMFQKNVRAKAVIVLLILGMMFAHAFPIIGAILTPHEGITDEDMIGSEEEEEPDYTTNVTGDVVITGDLRFNGTFHINGTLSLNYREVFPGENISQELVNESMGTGRVILEEPLTSVTGAGSLGGDFGFMSQWGFLNTEGLLIVNGILMLGELPDFSDLPDNKTGNGNGTGNETGGIPPEFLEFLIMMGMEDLIPILYMLEGSTTIEGNGTFYGNGTISGNGTIEGWVETKEDVIDFTDGQGYFSGIIIIFTMLLAAVICADIISADLANSSFVLYFSRPVRAYDYLLGKIIGVTWVMWLFCLIPPAVYVLVMIGTQSGDDFSTGFKILGKTLLVGLVTAFYFLPYGLMISSLTKSKAYAGIGIFMSFFVLLIVSGIFGDTSDKWSLISPVELLINFYKITFNGTIPSGITAGQVGGAILAFTVIPMAIVVFLIQRKGAGK